MDVVQLRICGSEALIEIRLTRNEANGPAHGRGAEQRALRTAQDFDALQVDRARIDGDRQRRVVDVVARGIGARDAANGDFTPVGDAEGVAGAEGQIRHQVRVVVETHDVELGESVGRDGRDAQGYRLDAFGPALGGDDDGR